MQKQTIAHDLQEKSRTEDVLLSNDNVTFDSMLLSGKVLEGLKKNGYKKPSPIQLKCIPLGRCGFDLIAKSKSGTGKTLVFSVVALESINATINQVQVLVLVPAREIAIQIEDVVRNIGCFIEDLKVASFIGGLPLDDDIEKLKHCHFAVGSPGRIKQLINKQLLRTDAIHLFVLDEADKLMESSFQKDINEIYHKLPQRKQIITSSATYSPELETFLGNYMLSPTHVSAENYTPLLLGLKQFVRVLTSSSNVVQRMKLKNEELISVLSNVSFTQCLIFTNFQSRANTLNNLLNQSGWESSFISAAQSQTKRLQAVNDLKEFKCRVLISTDLTARGIDASNVDLVVNYDVPVEPVTYLHRMGRAGRFGSSGICISLVCEATELVLMTNIIGTIGGVSLSIAKLPKLDGNKVDVWNVDCMKSLEQLYGTNPMDSEQIKKEVMALKGNNSNMKYDLDNEKDKKKKKSVENTNTKVKNVVPEKEKGNKNNSNELLLDSSSSAKEDSIGEVFDAKELFRKLATGNIDFLAKNDNDAGNKTKQEVDDFSPSQDARDIFKALASGQTTQQPEAIETDHIDVISRTISKSDSCQKSDNSNGSNKSKSSSIDRKSFNLCKNKALLGVAKLLNDPLGQIEEDITNSIGTYQAVIKNDDELLVESFLDEQKFDQNSSFVEFKKQLLEGQVVRQPPLAAGAMINFENVFQIGYDCAIKNDDGNTFLSYLPEGEVKNFEKYCQQNEANSSSSEYDDIGENNEEEQIEDFEDEDAMDTGGVVGNTNPDDDVDITRKWVPVSDNSSSNQLTLQRTNEINSSYDERFRSVFNDCSSNLWQYGLSFETVDDFDQWYYQWQSHVSSVRNYVQQNIYVDEMSRYQQHKY